MTKKLKKELLQIRIQYDLKKEYIDFCNKNGYSLSKRIRLLIKEDLKNDKKNQE